MLRLILDSVKFSKEKPEQTQVIVTLQSGEKQFVGQAKRLSTNDDYIIVAQATLDAVCQALPLDIELELDKAAPIKHDSIDKNLLVVTVNHNNNGKHLQLTGTCLSNDDQVVQNIAKATLDAINRLIAHLTEDESEL